MSVCKSAEKEGIAVLHGSRGTFHSEKQPAFRAVYKAFQEVSKIENFSKAFLLTLCLDIYNRFSNNTGLNELFYISFLVPAGHRLVSTSSDADQNLFGANY